MGVFSVVVQRHEQVLAIRDGKVVAVFGPGRYRRSRRSRRTTYERVDVRERRTTVAAQEILTADGVSVKVSAALTWSVSDPVAFTAVVDPEAAIYLSVQIALREALAGREAGEIVRSSRQEVTAPLLAAAREAGEPVGIDVASVAIKDIILPADLRAAFAELVATRQRGLAQLEAARAESASLRSLANAARLLDDHPALARLRLVQAATYGSKLVLDVTGAKTAGTLPS